MKMLLMMMTVSLASTGACVNAQDLLGSVSDEAGKPIKDTMISIYTARPRIGPGVL